MSSSYIYANYLTSRPLKIHFFLLFPTAMSTILKVTYYNHFFNLRHLNTTLKATVTKTLQCQCVIERRAAYKLSFFLTALSTILCLTQTKLAYYNID